LFALLLRGPKDKGNNGSKLQQNKEKHILDGDFKGGIHCCKIQPPSKGIPELGSRVTQEHLQQEHHLQLRVEVSVTLRKG